MVLLQILQRLRVHVLLQEPSGVSTSSSPEGPQGEHGQVERRTIMYGVASIITPTATLIITIGDLSIPSASNASGGTKYAFRRAGAGAAGYGSSTVEPGVSGVPGMYGRTSGTASDKEVEGGTSMRSWARVRV